MKTILGEEVSAAELEAARMIEAKLTDERARISAALYQSAFDCGAQIMRGRAAGVDDAPLWEKAGFELTTKLAPLLTQIMELELQRHYLVMALRRDAASAAIN